MKKIVTGIIASVVSVLVLTGCTGGNPLTGSNGEPVAEDKYADACEVTKQDFAAFKFVSVVEDERGAYCHVTADGTLMNGYENGLVFAEGSALAVDMTDEDAAAAINFAFKYHAEVYLDNAYVEDNVSSADWFNGLSTEEKDAWFFGYEEWDDDLTNPESTPLIYSGRVPALTHSLEDARFYNSGTELDSVRVNDDPTFGRILTISFESSVGYVSDKATMLAWIDSYGDTFYHDTFTQLEDSPSAQSTYLMTNATYGVAKNAAGEWRIVGWNHHINDMYAILEERKAAGTGTVGP